MARTISNRPDTEHEVTIGAHLEAKAGSRREFGRLLDQMNAQTRKPRRRRKKS